MRRASARPAALLAIALAAASCSGASPERDAEGPAYVALGDSYSSGEGVPPYDPETARDGNDCHRSAASYPRLLAARAPLGSILHRACSGAVVADVLDNARHSGEPPQIRWVGASTRFVTISVGGNDIGFADVGAVCLGPVNCRKRYSGAADEVARRVADLQPRLVEVYRRLAAAAPRATITVVGYPQIFAEVADGRCNLLSADETTWIREKTSQLDAAIETAALGAGVRYADVEDAFLGHELCTDVPWVVGLPRRGFFHPNADGHARLADLLARGFATEEISPRLGPAPDWDEWLPGDGHVHPMGHGDVDIPAVGEFNAEAKRLGLRWWVVTDHGPFLGCPARGVRGAATCTIRRLYDPEEGRRRWRAARRLAERASRATGVYVLMGQEIGNSAIQAGEHLLGGGRGHIASFQQRDYIEDPMPLPVRCRADCISRLAQEGPGAFGFIAHPSRGQSDWPDFDTVFESPGLLRGTIPGFEILDGDHRAATRDLRIWDDYLLEGRRVWVVGAGEVHYLQLAERVWGQRARTYVWVPDLPPVPSDYDATTGARAIKEALKAGRMLATNGPIATIRVGGRNLGEMLDVSAGERVSVEAFWKTEVREELNELLPTRLRVVFKYRRPDGTVADGTLTINLGERERAAGRWSGTIGVPFDFVRGFVRLEAPSADRLDAREGFQRRAAYTNPVFLS